MKTIMARFASVALALGLSTAAFAGGGGHHGGGMWIRPAGGMHGGGHGWGHGGYAGSYGHGAMRVGGGSGWGYGGHGMTSYGHTDTAMRGGYTRSYAANGFGERGRGNFRYGYGHVGTAYRGGREETRYAVRRFPHYGYGGAVYGSGYGGGYYGGDTGADAGRYGGSSGPVYMTGAGPAEQGTTETGYTGEPAPQGYAEPPLNAIGYGGGPHIIVVDQDRRESCTCHTSAPIVYRYGVGSYY